MVFDAERVTDCTNLNLRECPIPNVWLAGWRDGFVPLGGLQMGAGEGEQPSGGAEQGWAQHGTHKLKILCLNIFAGCAFRIGIYCHFSILMSFHHWCILLSEP